MLRPRSLSFNCVARVQLSVQTTDPFVVASRLPAFPPSHMPVRCTALSHGGYQPGRFYLAGAHGHVAHGVRVSPGARLRTEHCRG